MDRNGELTRVFGQARQNGVGRPFTFIAMLALLASCASGQPRGSPDFPQGTVWVIAKADGTLQLQIRLGSDDCRRPWGMVAIDTPAAGFLEPGTGEVKLNAPIDVTHGVNGEVRYDYRDSGEYARSASVTFTRSRGSTLWGRYRSVGLTGVAWEGAFAAKRCR